MVAFHVQAANKCNPYTYWIKRIESTNSEIVRFFAVVGHFQFEQTYKILLKTLA